MGLTAAEWISTQQRGLSMPRNYEEEYENAIQNKNRENANAVPNELHTPTFKKKINNFCKRHGFCENDVIDIIKSESKAGEIVRAFFAKDPKKQNIFEKMACEFIEAMGVDEFENLPNNELIVTNGAVMDRKTFKSKGGTAQAKTIDFKWKYKGATFYASHKYTKESGGAQDNQYKDLQAFIKDANHTTLDNTYFIVIADGPYYNTRDGETGKSRIDTLKSKAHPPAVHACTMGELETLMKEIVGNK